MLLSALVTYLILGPYLVSIGRVEYSQNPQELYNNMLFSFSISPAMGMLILGGFCLSALALVSKRILRKEGEEGGGEELGYLSLYKALWGRIIGSRRLALLVLGPVILLIAASYMLNPFHPLPRWFSLIFAIYSCFLASFLEVVILTKMAGETGMSMGVTGIVLYDLPAFLAGYRSYTGYIAAGYFRPSPWAAPSMTGLLRYRKEVGLGPWDIVKAKLMAWIPTFIIGAATTIALWRLVGFGNERMPAAGLLQGSIYVRMLATGSMRGTVDPSLFLAGGIIGAALEVLTPLSMTGLAMGMILPPGYAVPIAIGGVVRLLTDRRMGKDYGQSFSRILRKNFPSSVSL